MHDADADARCRLYNELNTFHWGSRIEDPVEVKQDFAKALYTTISQLALWNRNVPTRFTLDFNIFTDDSCCKKRSMNDATLFCALGRR